MSNSDLRRMKVLDVLGLYADILDDLWRREIVRSTNSPIADYAEYLVCEALSLMRAPKSVKGFDATDVKAKKKYEIKARRETKRSKPTRFSAIRDLGGKHFQYLVAVLFAEDFLVKRAAIIPRAVVKRKVFWQEHANASILPLSNALWSAKGVKDITQKLRKVQIKGKPTTCSSGRD